MGAPIWASLKNSEVVRSLSYFLDQLYCRGSRADYADSLSRENDFFVRPLGGMERRSFEVFHPIKIWNQGFGENPDSCDEEPATNPESVFNFNLPLIRRFIESALGYNALESDVASQVKLLGHMLEVSQVFWLSRKSFLPIPLVKQVLAKRIPVGITLGIEPGSRVPIPVPGATHIGS